MNKKLKNHTESSQVLDPTTQRGCEISIWEQLALLGREQDLGPDNYQKSLPVYIMTL